MPPPSPLRIHGLPWGKNTTARQVPSPESEKLSSHPHETKSVSTFGIDSQADRHVVRLPWARSWSAEGEVSWARSQSNLYSLTCPSDQVMVTRLRACSTFEREEATRR